MNKIPFLEGRARQAGGRILLRFAATAPRNRHALRTLRARHQAWPEIRRTWPAADGLRRLERRHESRRRKGQGRKCLAGIFSLRRAETICRFWPERAATQLLPQHCEAQAKTLQENIEKNAWDGQWYRRAYFDNGEPLGSRNQSRMSDRFPAAKLVGHFRRGRARIASARRWTPLTQRLVRRDAGLIQLFDPPFDKSPLDPGYIKGYVPGVRENGGQYTHAAIWTVMAFALAGRNRARVGIVHAASIPSCITQHAGRSRRVTKSSRMSWRRMFIALPPHTGRGGWTWYTGSAGWMYRLILETFLGVEIAVDELRFHSARSAGLEILQTRLSFSRNRLSHHLPQCFRHMESSAKNFP